MKIDYEGVERSSTDRDLAVFTAIARDQLDGKPVLPSLRARYMTLSEGTRRSVLANVAQVLRELPSSAGKTDEVLKRDILLRFGWQYRRRGRGTWTKGDAMLDGEHDLPYVLGVVLEVE